MTKPLDPKKIESARQFSSRAERREQRRKLMQDEIAENQRSNGVIMIPPKKLQEVQQERPKLRVAAYCRVSTQEEEQVAVLICRSGILPSGLKAILIGSWWKSIRTRASVLQPSKNALAFKK